MHGSNSVLQTMAITAYGKTASYEPLKTVTLHGSLELSRIRLIPQNVSVLNLSASPGQNQMTDDSCHLEKQQNTTPDSLFSLTI